MDTHGGLTNDLADWFPAVEATGVPVPLTLVLPLSRKLIEAMIDEREPDAELIAEMETLRHRAADFAAGRPLFLRTGEMSGKHSWESHCALDDAQRVIGQIANIAYFQAMQFGVPLPSHAVLRELLATEPAFYAFGGTPITRERRLFTRDGKVYDSQPYWPASAIAGHDPRAEQDKDSGSSLDDDAWRSQLATLSRYTDEELHELVELTERAAAPLQGDWSLDWLWTTDRGWVFIDAAHAEQSYVMPLADRLATTAAQLTADEKALAPAIAKAEGLAAATVEVSDPA